MSTAFAVDTQQVATICGKSVMIMGTDLSLTYFDQKNPPPTGVFYLLCFLIKSRV